MFRCIRCHSSLNLPSQEKCTCQSCAAVYVRDSHGYFVMLGEEIDVDSTVEEYAGEQHHCGQAVFERYLLDAARREPVWKVLDVGCGVGKTATALARAGFEAFGVDLPSLTRFWAAAKNAPDRFLAASGTSLPFSDDTFDLVYSFGVIEHVGTTLGHCTLAADYQRQRQAYAHEIVRVTKPGGRILIACPNKSFPIDIQHGPGDAAGRAGRVRTFVFDKTGMNVHKTWGRYHLVSYAELKKLFVDGSEGRELVALPLKNYFQFGRFKSGFLKPFGSLAEFWVNHMPARVRRSFLNPYVMAQIRK